MIVPVLESETQFLLQNVGVRDLVIKKLTVAAEDKLYFEELNFNFETIDRKIIITAKHVYFSSIDREKLLGCLRELKDEFCNKDALLDISIESMQMVHREKWLKKPSQKIELNEYLKKIPIRNLKIHQATIKSAIPLLPSNKLSLLSFEAHKLEDKLSLTSLISADKYFAEMSIRAHAPKININFTSTEIKLKNYNLTLKSPQVRLLIEDINNKSMILKHASFGAFMGHLSASGKINFDGASKVSLGLHNIDLKTLLDYYPQDKIEAVGTLKGWLPLNYEKSGFSISSGTIETIDKGYIKANLFDDNGSNAQLQLLSKALRNYNYDSLKSELNLKKNGDLQIAVKLKGQNPNLQNGRQINLNLDISENIPALIKSLKVASSLEKSVKNAIAK